MPFVYILRCADGTLYTGYARDPKQREQVHNNGRGAKYTRGRRPVRLVYSEACRSVIQALKREPRIERVLQADVRPGHEPPRDVVRISITAKLIGEQVPLNLVVPFSLEVGP